VERNHSQQRDPCDGAELLPVNVRDLGTGEVNKWPYINSDLWSDFDKAIREINDQIGTLGFTEIFRPTYYQEQIYNQRQGDIEKYNRKPWYRRGSPPLPADPPGTSAHEAGVAFDVPLYGDAGRYDRGEIEVITAAFVKNGFVQGVPGDPVHFVWKGWLKMSPEEKKGMINRAQAYYNCKALQLLNRILR